jgi:hypothetical protein
MINNATVLRLDPSGGPEGPELSIRGALTPLTAQQQRMNEDAGWDATGVLYIPLKLVPDPSPEVSGYALVRADVEVNAALYTIKHIIQNVGHTLGHIQLFLALVE